MRPNYHCLSPGRNGPTSPSHHSIHHPSLSHSFLPVYFNFAKNNNTLFAPTIFINDEKLQTSKSTHREYESLLNRAIQYHESLHGDMALTTLNQAIKGFPSVCYLAHILHAEILNSQRSGSSGPYCSLSCKERKEYCLQSLRRARNLLISQDDEKEIMEGMKRVHINLPKEEETTQVVCVESNISNNSKIINAWIESVEFYITQQYDLMRDSAMRGIRLGETEYSLLERKSLSSSGSSSSKIFSGSASPGLPSTMFSSNIFQHTFTNEIEHIQTHRNDFIMSELWKALYVSSSHLNVLSIKKSRYHSCSNLSSYNPVDGKQLYRFLCKSLAYGNLRPSLLLCWLANTCFTIEEYPNGSQKKYANLTHTAPSSRIFTQASKQKTSPLKRSTSIDFNGDETSPTKSAITTANLFSPSNRLTSVDAVTTDSNNDLLTLFEFVQSTNKRSNKVYSASDESEEENLSLSEIYYRDSFLINENGSLEGSLSCIRTISEHAVEKIFQLMKLYPIQANYSAEVWSLLGHMYYRDGEDKKSDHAFLHALSLNPIDTSIYESMSYRFFLMCYRFFLFSEQKFVSQVEKLFNQVFTFAMENATNDKLLNVIRGKQRALLYLTRFYFDTNIDQTNQVEEMEDRIEHVIETESFYEYLDLEEQRFGLVCKYTQRIREKLLRQVLIPDFDCSYSNKHLVDVSILFE